MIVIWGCAEHGCATIIEVESQAELERKKALHISWHERVRTQAARDFILHLNPDQDFPFLTRARISIERDNRSTEELSQRYKPVVK